MKGLVILGVIGFLGIMCTWWLMSEMNKDPGVPVLLAIGNPHDGKIDVHVCVQLGLTTVEPPRVDLQGVKHWDEWVEKHFILHSDGGDNVTLRFTAGSSLIPDHKAGGVPEGYLIGTLKQSESYTFDHIPSLQSGKKYRYKFKAVEGEKKMSRETFALVTK